MSDMRGMRTRSMVSDKHVRGDSSNSPKKVIDTAKLGLKRKKLDKSNLSENSARDEKLKELACVAVQGEVSNEVPDPSKIVFDSAEKISMLFEKYNAVQVNFDNFVNNKRYGILSTIEQNYCKRKSKQVDTRHKKCMDLMEKVNAPDQGQGHGMVTESVDQTLVDLEKTVEDFEALRKKVEKTVEARQRIKKVGLSGIDKQDLHYIILKDTQKAKEYIDSTIESNKGNRIFEGKEILGSLIKYKALLDNFASAMKTGKIDTAYDHLGMMKNAALALESKLKIYHFGSRLFEGIDFEFKNVRDI